MLWHPSCALFCLLVCLLFCFLLLNVHLRACLIFSSDFVLCLIVFCRQIAHIYISCFSTGSCRCRFLDLSDFLSTHFRFCCLHRPFIVFTLLLASCFALLQIFLMFFLARFVLAFFAVQISGLHQFALARFRFFGGHCLFFLLCSCSYTFISHSAPLPSPLFLHMVPSNAPWQSLPTSCIFPLCTDIQKRVVLAYSLLFLPCFCSFPWSHTLLHPSEPIRIHLYSILSIFGKTQKTSCPGKFPRP